MKRLSKEEFVDRTQAVLRARKIFIDSQVTNNVTIAFELYQKVIADREREIQISTGQAGRWPYNPMDEYERPKCPECGSDTRFRPLPLNEKGIKTQLVCSSPLCDTVLNSEHDLAWWMKKLKRKDEPE